MVDAPKPVRNYVPDFRQTLPEWTGEQIYLVSCAPKSASTYASSIISEYIGRQVFFAGKVPDRAIQDLDSVWIESAVADGQTIIHQHVPWHETTRAYVDAYKIRPIAIVRDLADTIPSVRDHLRLTINGSWPGVHVDQHMLGRSDHELDILISHLIMPWYFTYYAGWLESGYPILTYDQVISDPGTMITALGLPLDPVRLDQAIVAARKRPNRLNVGTRGRGLTVAPEALEHLQRLATHYAHLDLTPIMSGCLSGMMAGR